MILFCVLWNKTYAIASLTFLKPFPLSDTFVQRMLWNTQSKIHRAYLTFELSSSHFFRALFFFTCIWIGIFSIFWSKTINLFSALANHSFFVFGFLTFIFTRSFLFSLLVSSHFPIIVFRLITSNWTIKFISISDMILFSTLLLPICFYFFLISNKSCWSILYNKINVDLSNIILYKIQYNVI